MVKYIYIYYIYLVFLLVCSSFSLTKPIAALLYLNERHTTHHVSVSFNLNVWWWCETLTNLPAPCVEVFFTNDQLVSFNLVGSAKPVYVLQNSNFSYKKSLIIIFCTLLLIRIFSIIKNFIFIPF